MSQLKETFGALVVHTAIIHAAFNIRPLRIRVSRNTCGGPEGLLISRRAPKELSIVRMRSL